jgi:hypothetical protein
MPSACTGIEDVATKHLTLQDSESIIIRKMTFNIFRRGTEEMDAAERTDLSEDLNVGPSGLRFGDPNLADLDRIFGAIPHGGEFVVPPDTGVLEYMFDKETAHAIAECAFNLVESGEWSAIYAETQAELDEGVDDYLLEE